MTGLKLTLFVLCVLMLNRFDAKGSDAELISQHDVVEVFGSKLIKTSTYRIQINNRAGEKYGRIRIEHSDISKISKLEAHLETISGQVIRKLSNAEIKEHSAISDISFYDDNRVTEFTLKHNRYPYIVEYSYERKVTEFLFLDYWIPVLDMQIPTHEATLTVNIPIDYKLKYSAHDIEEPEIESSGKTTQYIWKATYNVLAEAENFAPDLSQIVPCLKVVPKEFNFQKRGSFESWVEYGDWQVDILKQLNELPEWEKQHIHRLTDGITDERQKVKVLYHDMQDATRYVNISIETGGMKPHPASYVAENKYGDCKALSNYFKSVLDVIGIKSYYVKIYAGNPCRPIDQSFPSQQFNHVILMVPLEKDTLWLDCTSDGPFNYLGTFTQNRYAFVVEQGNSHFEKTPAMQLADVAESRTICVGFPEKGSSAVSFSGNYKGDLFEKFRQLDSSYSQADQDRIFRNYLLEDGFELQDYSIRNLGRDTCRIEVEYETVNHHLYKTYGNEILVSNIPINVPDFEKPEERQFPVQIDDPVCRYDTVTYAIGEGYQVDALPEVKVLETTFGTYTIQFDKSGNQVVVCKQLTIYPGTHSLEAYPAFYSFIKEVKTVENSPLLILTKKA
ncbi:DUF3857 domain-containing protein [Mangrovibacterium lignilyticum]|uniref:DUF3857 domain-containing protein n=1 Tax=Mangrovibacterium lignilyticum TaxID=2668052 RepID=UPI0013D880F4|nr:DUF3857 domain-containing protein [Mangrovibacterium lignilyticum]